tara:strand:- start:8 stop:274 length:267 start_codon:yes stop_codon:yes gene_type:complete
VRNRFAIAVFLQRFASPEDTAFKRIYTDIQTGRGYSVATAFHYDEVKCTPLFRRKRSNHIFCLVEQQLRFLIGWRDKGAFAGGGGILR